LIALATRGSALARAQTELAIAALRSRFPTEEFTAVVVDSDGDLSPAALAPDLPGQGWFTSRLELALRSGQVDGAIHSAKDLPAELGPDLLLAGFLRRADPRDALVSAGAGHLADLAPGARVGTSSPRRSVQLLALRPDLRCEPIRGNVDSRIRKVRDGEFDGCVVAMAGLDRLGRAEDGVALDPRLECTPAPAQGAIALQARVGSRFADLAAAIDDRITRDCVEAERRVLTEMGGGCQLPLGTLAEALGKEHARLTVAWPSASEGGVRRITHEGLRSDLTQIAVAMSRELS
jgi:hydroxymethylbilane synthase